MDIKVDLVPVGNIQAQSQVFIRVVNVAVFDPAKKINRHSLDPWSRISMAQSTVAKHLFNGRNNI
jgi:hypothetical protein